MIIGWKGQTWGTGDIEVLAAPGLEDRALGSASITGGIDGGVATPQFSDIGAFVADIVIFADSDEDMAAKVEAVFAATWGTTDRVSESPFDFTIRGQEQSTVFARVTNRTNPTDFQTADRYRAMRMQIAYEATDPMVYGPEVEAALEVGDGLTIAGGWAPSQRWTWIAHGEVVNPRLTLETDGYADQVLRCVRTVNTGQNLLVDSTSANLITTVGGFNRFDDFDGGNTNVAAQFFSVLPGQTLRYSGGEGGGGAVFRYRPARP